MTNSVEPIPAGGIWVGVTIDVEKEVQKCLTEAREKKSACLNGMVAVRICEAYLDRGREIDSLMQRIEDLETWNGRRI